MWNIQVQGWSFAAASGGLVIEDFQNMASGAPAHQYRGEEVGQSPCRLVGCPQECAEPRGRWQGRETVCIVWMDGGCLLWLVWAAGICPVVCTLQSVVHALQDG